MSNVLAIPGVTAVLQFFLNNVYNNPGSVLGSVSVSAVAPDIVQNSLGGGNNAQLQVNLFLHQVTPNAAWRNIGLPSLGSDGVTALKNQPLALDLHYLLTAYAAEDSQAEALLSFGVLMLHESPILARGQIRAALAGLPPTYPPPYAQALSQSGLADQIEMIEHHRHAQRYRLPRGAGPRCYPAEQPTATDAADSLSACSARYRDARQRHSSRAAKASPELPPTGWRRHPPLRWGRRTPLSKRTSRG